MNFTSLPFGRLVATAAVAALAAVALVAGGAQPAAGDQPRVAIVVGGSAAAQPALLERARAAAAHAHGVQVELRVPRTPTEELGVTHVLAAGGVDAVIGVDLDRAVSVDPVARKYSGVHFVTAGPGANGLERALAAVSD
jgi:hypothetical protein